MIIVVVIIVVILADLASVPHMRLNADKITTSVVIGYIVGYDSRRNWSQRLHIR